MNNECRYTSAELREREDRMYRAGFIDALKAMAFWQDGKEVLSRGDRLYDLSTLIASCEHSSWFDPDMARDITRCDMSLERRRPEAAG